VHPASADGGHGKLEKEQDVAAILSDVEGRQVKPNYTVPIGGRHYVIERAPSARGCAARRSRRGQLDGTPAMRFEDTIWISVGARSRPKEPR
jgi:hypothetical protein